MALLTPKTLGELLRKVHLLHFLTPSVLWGESHQARGLLAIQLTQLVPHNFGGRRGNVTTPSVMVFQLKELGSPRSIINSEN